MVLRPLRSSDAERVNVWHNDVEIYRTLLGDFYGPTLEETRTWLSERCIAHGGGELNLAICRRGDGEHIGNFYLRDIDRAAQIAQFHGIFLGVSDDRARGVGRDATTTVMRYAFDELGLQRVWGLMLADNHQSRRAMEAVGFEVTEHIPRGVTKDGQPRDVIRIDLTPPLGGPS